MTIKANNIKKGAISVLFLAVFVDLLEFGIIIPLLPFWSLDLGATPFLYGILASAYSFMSFIAAPLWGKLSDNYGRRPVILAGLIGTVLGLGTLLLTATVFIDSLFMLFLSRLIGGFFTAATLPASQAYIADTTEGKDRAKGFGLLGAAFGLGFALGPGIGGLLSYFGGYALPAFFSTVLAVINLIAAIKFLPESLTSNMKKQTRTLVESIENKPSIRSSISKPTIFLAILLFAIISLAFSKMQATLALLGNIRFGLDETTTGVIFFIVGLVVVITQAGLIRPLTNRFSDTTLLTVGLLFLSLGFLGLSTVSSLETMIIWVIPLAFGSSISNPTLGAFLSKEAPQDNSGAILGLNQGVGSFMRISGPLIGTALFEINAAFPYYLGAIILLIGLFLALIIRYFIKRSILGYPCLRCGITLQEGVAICGRCGLDQFKYVARTAENKLTNY
ncbi:MFS transporter [Candidatus Hodarchaeum mangrovi]